MTDEPRRHDRVDDIDRRATPRSGHPVEGVAMGARFRELPVGGRFFVAGVIAAALLVVAMTAAAPVPADLVPIGVLVGGAVVVSGLKLRLPLGSSSSNLSTSYTFDFITLLLFGPGPATVVAAVGAWAQSSVTTTRRTQAFRVVFNVAALTLTVQAASAAFIYAGGQPGTFTVVTTAKPLVAAALVYYLANTSLVALAVALTTRQCGWSVWHSSFLWTAPSYFVGAGAAAAAVVMWQGREGWLMPLAAAPVYLTFRSYRIYVDRIRSEKRHNEEVLRLLDVAQRSEQRYALAAAGSNDGLWDWDIPAQLLYFSDRWRQMIGLSADASICSLQQWIQCVHEDDRGRLEEALDAHLNGPSLHFEHEYRIRHANGGVRFVLCRGIVVRDEIGRAIRMAGSQTDVSEWRTVQHTLARAARHDPLTGLPNRAFFGEMLQREIAQSARKPETRYAVLFVDLDGFKLVNDSLGHLIGDQFLVAIAQRLQSKLRPTDSLARLGGDEFAVLVTDVGTVAEVQVVAERMQGALAEPFELQGREIYASASVGIVVGGEEYKSVADLLRDADTAMYRAKAAGRGGYEIFDPAMHQHAMNRLTLETELRRAVERNEFVVYYQPIVRLDTSEICGFEALVRWARPEGWLAPPGEFIAVCEETGLVVPMTSYVLREACRQAAVWQEMFNRPLSVSVNISSRLFSRGDLIQQVEQAIASSGIASGTLCLEITESVLMQHSDLLDRNFEQLRAMRVPLYLDDFGTGYSSLSYLQRYPVDALKLDRSFVVRMGSDDDCVIANVIAKLARELGTGLIAEGVETEAQAEELRALRCPHAQGALFSEALPAAAAEALLWRAFPQTLAEAS